jgi:cytochrome P450
MEMQNYLPPRPSPFLLPEMLHRMRTSDHLEKVTLWDGRKIWLVTRYEDACFVLRDNRFSSAHRHGNQPMISAGRLSAPGALGRTDEPRHREMRRLLSDEFLLKRVEALRPAIERIVTAQLERLLETPQPADFHAEFSSPIPTLVLNLVLGASAADQQEFRRCLNVLIDRTTGQAEKAAADQGLYARCVQVIKRKEKEPGDDMISRCVVTALREGSLHPEEAYRTMVQMITGGQETAANTITLGALTMLLNPEWRETIRDRPEAVPTAVEELLRFHAPQPDGLSRVALDDVMVGGTLVSAGDPLLISVASANRDEAVFDQPDDLDHDRQEARRHLTFGDGIHRCIGQWLARAELQIALHTVATRMPTLRLAVPFEDLSFTNDRFVYGVRELPVAW